MSQPQYIGEFAPTHLRGLLVGLYGACFQFGSVFVRNSVIIFSFAYSLSIDGSWSDRIERRFNGTQ
jgi:hypothetical protein